MAVTPEAGVGIRVAGVYGNGVVGAVVRVVGAGIWRSIIHSAYESASKESHVSSVRGACGKTGLNRDPRQHF